jgi:Uma2 family endonuclease
MALLTQSPSISSSNGRLFTVADVDKMPRDLPSGPVDYELDNGRIITMSPPSRVHGVLQVRIGAALISFGDRQGHGQTMVESGIVLWRNPDRLVGPDVAFFSQKSFPLQESSEGYLETIPDIVFEVYSKNDTDAELRHKVADYLAAGVKQVFTVEPDRRTITRHRVGTPASVLSENDVLSLDEIIPGFALALSDFFRV